MKIILDETILEIGSAGLRCGRWAIKHKKDKLTAKKVFDIGYHTGKCYAYLYSLSLLGLVEFLNPSKILNFHEFMERYGKGKVWVFYEDWTDPVILMKESVFEAILKSKQPHQGPIITKEIRKLCQKI